MTTKLIRGIDIDEGMTIIDESGDPDVRPIPVRRLTVDDEGNRIIVNGRKVYRPWSFVLVELAH